MNLIDVHTHSVASGHGQPAMIHQLAQQAAKKQLNILCITDHGPATLGSAKPSYFRSLASAPKSRYGVRLLYGCETNILDTEGTIDLSQDILKHLDFNIASLHTQNLCPGTVSENTTALLRAMDNPYIHMIGHPDDEKYPVNYKVLVEAAVQTHTLLELNRASLAPDSYRKNAAQNDRQLLFWCAHYRHPIVLGSDSHGTAHVGDFTECEALLKEVDFPKALVLNTQPELFLDYIKVRKR